MGAREITMVSRPEKAVGENGEAEAEPSTDVSPDSWRVRVPARLARGESMAVVIGRTIGTTADD